MNWLKANSSARFILMATAFELGLFLIALPLSWGLQGRWLPPRLGEPEGSLWSWFLLAGVAPAILAGVLTSRWVGRWRWMAQIHSQVADSIGHYLSRIRWPGLGWIAFCAGWGEEFLFRGVLEPVLGLWISSLLFAAAHFLSVGYFFLAWGMGLLLSALQEFTGSLWMPICAHAIYDATALILLRRRFLQGKDSP